MTLVVRTMFPQKKSKGSGLGPLPPLLAVCWEMRALVEGRGGRAREGEEEDAEGGGRGGGGGEGGREGGAGR